MKKILEHFTNKKNLKPLIIAEISANHCGKKNLFLQTIKMAHKNGADLIKIQTYEPNDITVPSLNKKETKIWKLYDRAKTPFDWHADAFKLANSIGAKLFSTPFSIRAVDLLEKFKVKLYKISSFEITDYLLIDRVAKTKKPVIVSTGMASINEIKNCIKIIKKYHNKIILLHCVSGYPTSIQQANLRRIETLKNIFPNYNIGLSDHTNDIVTSLVAIARGASVIEKHFKISNRIKSLDSKFSIDSGKLKTLCNHRNKIYLSLGDGKFKIQSNEKKSVNYRRSIYATKEIDKGEKLSNFNITTFRPTKGIPSQYYFSILGKKVKKKINKYQPILFKNIK